MKFKTPFPLFSTLLVIFFFQENSIGQSNQEKNFSYTITITDSTACLMKADDGKSEFKVYNHTDCPVFLKFASTLIHVTGDLKTTYKVFDAGSIILQNDSLSKLPHPNITRKNVIWDSSDTACKNKLALEIENCASADLSNSKAETESDFIFIPGPVLEEKFRILANNTESALNCCPGSMELLYNVNEQCLIPVCEEGDCQCIDCLKKKKQELDSCKTCIAAHLCDKKIKRLKTFHPMVDEKLRIRFVGLNPYRDSIGVSVSFYDKNQEGKQDFEATLPKNGSSNTASGNASNGGATKAQSGTITTTFNFSIIGTFQKEMMLFYNSKKTAPSVSPAFIALCVSHIESNIIKYFQVSSATPDSLLKNLNTFSNAAKIPENQRKIYEQQLNEGLRYFKMIQEYHVFPKILTQVENADITQVDVQFFQNGKAVTSKPQSFRFFNRGGFTFNYSSGIMINWLVDHSYRLINTKDASGNDVKKISQNQGDKINLGPAILGHAYYRYPICNRFKVGATTGFISNTTDNALELGFLFGGSILFGFEQRLVLSGGWIIGKVSRIADGYAVDDIVDPAITDVPMRDVYRTRAFIGISYNLGK